MDDTIFVGNLPFSVTSQELERLFSVCGPIKEVRIPIHRESGKPRGFAFLTFNNAEDAKSALSFNDRKIDDRPMRVNFSQKPHTNVNRKRIMSSKLDEKKNRS